METIKKYVPPVAIVLIAFLAIQTINGLKTYHYIGSGVPENVISVSGDGEVFATPDVATFTWTVTETGKDVKDAQTKASAKVNAALASLEKNNIDKKDIKTINFNAYPKYEYNQVVCVTYPCSSSKQTLVGYEVSQTILVKVRAVDEAAKVIDGVTSSGISEVSSVSFTIDDEDALMTDARAQAIKDAKEKAEVLAKDLGVDLVRIVNFSDNNGGYPIPMYGKAEMSVSMDGAGNQSAPSLPTGQNKITSKVTITYEVR